MTSTRLPLVGRSPTVEMVQGRLRDRGHVVLQGPAGIGKTRIAAEAVQGLRTAGRQVDRLLANESGGGVHLSVLAPLGPPPSVTVDDQAAVFAWFLRRWRERGATDAPAVVWVDDLPHCDPLSEAVLRQAVVTGAVQLIGTHRSNESLGAGMQALVTEGLLVPVSVGPLHRRAADDLARAVADAHLDRATLHKVHALAAGNPLFIRELVRGMNGAVDLGASTTLDTIIGRPIRSLSGSCRRTLDLIAVAEPAPVALLSSRWDDVQQLVGRGLVARHGDTLRLDHPLRRAWVLSDLGSLVPTVLGDLLDLVHQQDLAGYIEPVTLTDWQLRADRSPNPAMVERATRLAIARRDGRTALRFAAALQGPEARLLHGQALIVSGEVEAGLTALEVVAAHGPLAVRVEAAFWQARYLGLMLGDYPRAEAALDAVDDPQMPGELRRFVIGGRVWLWTFGPVGDAGSLRTAYELSLHGPDDEVTFEICHATGAVFTEIANPTEVEPLLRRCRQLEDAVAISDQARSRARTVQMWWEIARGEGDAAARTALAAFERSRTRHDIESIALLAGSAGWLLALTGRIRDACTVSRAVEAVPETDDWFQFRTLALPVDQGNRCLLTGAADAADLVVPDTLGSRLDLDHLFTTRASILVSEAGGQPVDGATLVSTLRLLVESRKHLWAGLLGLEVTSLSTGAAVLELLSHSGRCVPGPGIVAVAGRVARARLDGDAATLLRCGQDLELAGLNSPAMRVWADVTRLAGPETAAGLQSRAALLRLLRTWDGAYPRWLEALDAIPTPRQMEIAWKVLDGASAQSVAAQLYLSRRTVENHLHRVYRSLQVHGREDLLEALRPSARPQGWRPGDY